MTLGYTYENHRLKNTSESFCKIAHTGRITAWIPLRLAWTTELWGRDQSLICPRLPTLFAGTNNQEVLKTFNNSTYYTLWDSESNNSINPYFEINTHCKPLGKEDCIEINGIRGIINTKGIVTFALILEDYIGKLQHIIFKNVYYFPGAPNIFISPQEWAQDRGEYEFGREGTYLKVMGKRSVLV